MEKIKQHHQPCKQCPFRRRAFPAWLGDNDPQVFALLANRDGHFLCHLTPASQCAGRAIMWANSCKVSRDNSVMNARPDRTTVFSNIAEFITHHKITISMLQLMGFEPLDKL